MIVGKCPVCGADMKIGSDMTNADRIRSMTDNDIARFIYNVQSDAYSKGLIQAMIKDYPAHISQWLEWVKEEVKCNNCELKDQCTSHEPSNYCMIIALQEVKDEHT